MRYTQKSYGTLGAFIRETRLKRGWTVIRLAEEVGVGRVIVHGWERGAVRPAAASLGRIMDALDVGSRERAKWWEMLAAAPSTSPMS